MEKSKSLNSLLNNEKLGAFKKEGKFACYYLYYETLFLKGTRMKFKLYFVPLKKNNRCHIFELTENDFFEFIKKLNIETNLSKDKYVKNVCEYEERINWSLSEFSFYYSPNGEVIESIIKEGEKQNEDLNIEYQIILNSIDKSNNRGIRDEFFDENKLHKPFLRLFNVNSANASALFVYNEVNPLWLFDLGNNNQNKTLRNLYQNLDSKGYILISHFDSDHINGYKDLSNDAFKRVFVMRRWSNSKKSKMLMGLGEKLKNTPNLKSILFPRSTPFSSQQIGAVTIISGNTFNPPKPPQSTTENANSLISIISINNKTALLPADGLYNDFNINKNHVDFFCIAHHGCFYSDPIPFSANEGFVFVKSPCHKNYRHPDCCHLCAATKTGAIIKRFGDLQNKMFSKTKEINDSICSMVHGDYMNWFFI